MLVNIGNNSDLAILVPILVNIGNNWLIPIYIYIYIVDIVYFYGD